ncbi:MAG: DEAD/DEAH box helicase [Bacteroidales bacterium]|nr:DEAD/DEAH box helicase [Bacteroidales bacterium]
MYFSEFGFDDELMDSLDAMNFNEATPIQSQAIPVILDGKDLIACAQTGTGKTAAYLLPVIDHLLYTTPVGIDTVILVPTRELAIQIDQQMEGFGYYVPVNSTAIYGGNDSGEWGRQRKAIEDGADMVIATPGRLLQHMAMGYVDFSHVKHLILDEADRMLDMGFFDDIMQVVKQLPTDRQTLMFSATMPPKIRNLAKEILNDPAEISIAISKPAENIKQGAYVVYDPQKNPLIKSILKSRKDQSIIVFSSKKQSCKELAIALRRAGFNSGVIHSDLDQKTREDVLLQFRNHNINILVATDIIARGIDIKEIDMVINYDVPRDAEDYVHRIGRTARAQSSGEAYTLINENDMQAFGRIERLIEKEVEKLKLPEELGEGPAYNPGRRNASRNGHGGQQHGRQSQGKNSQGRSQGHRSSKNKHAHHSKGGKSNNAQSLPSAPETN